jgi:hypothetical protein
VSAFRHPDHDFADLRRRVAQLPDSELIELYGDIRVLLGEVAMEDKTDLDIARRRRALECLRRAHDHLGRGYEQPLPARDYDRVRDTLDLPLSASAIKKAYGRWKNAQKALGGGHVPLNATQREVVRQASRHPKPAPGSPDAVERYLGFVRLFLDSNPSSPTRDRYLEWRRDYNQTRDPDDPPACNAANLSQVLGARRWIDIVSSARAGELVSHSADAPGPILTKFQAARLAGATSGWVVQSKDFPAPIARMGRCPVYLRSDVLAYRRGAPFPKRKPFANQSLIVDAAEIANLLGERPRTVRSRVTSHAWHLIPKPALTAPAAGTAWLRRDVERWLEERGASPRAEG